MTIPAIAIEAAARAINPAVWGPQVWTFQAHGETPTEARNRVQQEALQQARAVLEAAAPYVWSIEAQRAIFAAAWESGCKEGLRANPGREDNTLACNPYRAAAVEGNGQGRRDVKGLWAALTDGSPEWDESAPITSSEINRQTADRIAALSVSEDEYCCTPDSGDCCGPGSWCCARSGEHEHEDGE